MKSGQWARLPNPARMPSVFLLRRNRPALLNAQRALFGAPEQDQALRWTCVGASDRLYEALPRIAELGPDVLACDLRLADGHVLALLQRLPTRPRPRLLLLSSLVDDPMLFEALAAGAQGYWVDAGASAGLVEALTACMAGQATMSPALARQTLETLGLPRSELLLAHNVAASQDLAPAVAGDIKGLARCEQHLLTLIAQGLLIEEIAQRWQLQVSEIARRLADIYALLQRRLALRRPQAAGGAVSMKL
jgi:DNA-binding NarL/FixJ family response regulator